MNKFVLVDGDFCQFFYLFQFDAVKLEVDPASVREWLKNGFDLKYLSPLSNKPVEDLCKQYGFNADPFWMEVNDDQQIAVGDQFLNIHCPKPSDDITFNLCFPRVVTFSIYQITAKIGNW